MNSRCPKARFISSRRLPAATTWPSSTKLLDERILAVPGSGFGGPGHFRLAFCVEDEVIARSAEGFKRARRVGKPFRAARQPPVSRGTRKKSTGTASSWVPDGRIPACRRNHFPGLAISVPFNPIPPNASGLAAAFPRFSSPFKKTRGLPCVLGDISRDWKPHQNLRDGNVFPWGGLLRFPHHERSHSLDTSRSTV